MMGGIRRQGDDLPISLIFLQSDGTDFLAHKNEITDPKAKNGDGYDRDQMGKDDQKALQKWKWVLETQHRKLFHGPHKD